MLEIMNNFKVSKTDCVCLFIWGFFFSTPHVCCTLPNINIGVKKNVSDPDDSFSLMVHWINQETLLRVKQSIV